MWATTGLADLQHVGPQTLVKGVTLAGYLLAARQERISAFKVQPHGLRRDALHRAVDNLSFLLDITSVLRFPFGFADALQDDLLGGLRRDAPEVLGGAFNHHLIPHFDIRLDNTRVR